MLPKTLDTLDNIRISFNSATSRTHRLQIGQFLTPAAIAQFMSSMFGLPGKDVRILDPGAGAGVLFAACVQSLVLRKDRPLSIDVVAYETDGVILPFLEKTMKWCEVLAKSNGISFHGSIRETDFVSAAIAATQDTLFSVSSRPFTHVILNPPYKKINSRTATRRMLYGSGIEVANLYAAFVWLSMRLLERGGQMVAITPRSFCNGPYFKKFRLAFLNTMSLRWVHLFASRKKAFGDDDVLQENVIFHAIRGVQNCKFVTISQSEGIDFKNTRSMAIPYSHVVLPGDSDAFIHLGIDDATLKAITPMECFRSSLSQLNLGVSTGPTVDFRAKEHLRQKPEQGTAPLIYPAHFRGGFINWPAELAGKATSVVYSSATTGLFVEAGYYVLAKRFSSKEQPKRIMAAIYDPARISADHVSFENHLNYFHRGGRGLPPDIAKGLALYLNSTIVDQYFRRFSGHTQVNATDLRKMPYPSYKQLLRLGAYVKKTMPDQKTIDAIMRKECENNE